VHLTRRQGRKQWSTSEDWAEMEAQHKARQAYEQTTGLARWRHGAAFWDLRGEKG
jgi:maltoporin